MTVFSLNADEVRAAVSMPEAIGAVREALLQLADGHFEQPARTVMGAGRFLVMATQHRPTSSAMVKTLSLDFQRVPAITGTVTWTELSGADVLVVDAAPVTALRTGAICGVATDLLAAPKADTMAIIGAGAQAPDQIRAVHAVRPLRSLRIVARGGVRAAALTQLMTDELTGTEVHLCDTVPEAVAGAGIVSCATPATEPVLSGDALESRVHVNAIGAYRPEMRELPDDLLAESTIVIDDMHAALEESGEIRHALAAERITAADLTTLATALSQGVTPRPRTVFKSVGIAVQDWAIAHLLASRYLH